jgi:hypothetical protein
MPNARTLMRPLSPGSLTFRQHSLIYQRIPFTNLDRLLTLKESGVSFTVWFLAIGLHLDVGVQSLD